VSKVPTTFRGLIRPDESRGEGRYTKASAASRVQEASAQAQGSENLSDDGSVYDGPPILLEANRIKM
jgi:hypothetical protein